MTSHARNEEPSESVPVCFICERDGEEQLCAVRETGKSSFEEMLSEAGEDTTLERLKSRWENDAKSVRYHKSCKLEVHNKWKSLSRKRINMQLSEKEEFRNKKQRSCTTEGKDKVSLPYKNKCILCNELVCLYTKKPQLARKTYSRPDSKTAEDLKRRVLKTANERLRFSSNDKWAMEVKGRLMGINDLVAEEALMHKRCNSNFLRFGSNDEGDSGRKVDDERLTLLNELCEWLDQEMEHNLFTLDQLYKKMLSLDKSPDKSLAYTKRYLKSKLLERYGDEIYFTSQERRADVLCFKDATANIIREHQENVEDDEKTKILKTAVKFIQNDIALVNLVSSIYPSVDSMVDINSQLELIPESLKLILKPLLKTDKRVASWGQNIIRTCRPRSGVLPLPMRFSLQMDHRFGSKWLLEELHSFGYCESYQEVSNYKYCYIRKKWNVETSSLFTIHEEAEDDCTVEDELQELLISDIQQPEEQIHSEIDSVTAEYSGVQYVGDNIDLNIVSINGNTPFHAMGMIKVIPRNEAVTNDYLTSTVPRLRITSKDKAKILKAGDIPIKPCRDPKNSGINSVTLKPLTELVTSVSCTPAVLNPADAIWTAGWIIKVQDGTFSHANWNGWMKSAYKSDSEETSHIEYQPIIDGDPNDFSTIFTVLLRCIELEKTKMPVVTFDLPIWLKSVDISLSKSLKIITRLGGFHLLKSFLGTFGNIFADSGLHDVVQLIYPGQLVADSILNGTSYDKAIRAHFLIDAALVQHAISPDMFTEEELSTMTNVISNVSENHQGIDPTNIPIAEVFQHKIRSEFEKFDDVGRTAALWALYHKMVETIKIFIRAERVGDFSLHLSCIANRMLQVFAAAGHHNYAKAARLYVQLMMSYEEGSVEQSEIIRSFKTNRSHVVRYSSHEWSGIWTDLCIEQTLMRTSKSNGGLSGGRFRNGESAHRCWVQTLSHMSLINRLSQQVKSQNIHRDLATAQRLADEKAVMVVNNWFNEMQPFDDARDANVLISFSTGFFSRGNDGINPEKTLEIGNQIQAKLDGHVPTTKIEKKFKVKSLAMLRKLITGADANTPVNALKYFNRLVIFAQRESNLEISLGHELTPIPLSLFSEKDQLMHEGNKAAFVQACLKDNVIPKDMKNVEVGCLVVDGGWLIRQSRWAKGENWADIVDGYVQFVQSLGRNARNIVVVFDGYNKSTKDHTHRRRQKLFCHDMNINLENVPYTAKEFFLSNGNNKTELIKFLSDALRNAGIDTLCCIDDADTTIVRSALDQALEGAVVVRAEDADILILLVHHYDAQKHHSLTLTTSKGSYDIDEIVKTLSDQQKRYILMCHSFTGNDTVSSIYGFSKEKLFKKLCAGDLDQQLDVFYNKNATKNEIEQAGIKIFQYIYNSKGLSLSTLRLHQYNKQAKVGVIRPESLAPTDGAAAQHSLRAFLQLQDWLLLKSMSRDPENYGWYQTANGYEPVLTTAAMAPANLLKFVSCNCKGDCTSQRCSCKKTNVKCISACGNCYGTQCKNIDNEIGNDN